MDGQEMKTIRCNDAVDVLEQIHRAVFSPNGRINLDVSTYNDSKSILDKFKSLAKQKRLNVQFSDSSITV